jgi:DNA-binding MarR family transcriptional regulator
VRDAKATVKRKSPAASPPRAWRPELGADFTPRFSADQHVGTALRETFRLFAQSVSGNLSGLGLSLNMWFVLRALWESDGLTQVDLAARLDVSPAAMVGIVNALEGLGLVARKLSKTDGRAYCIFLTAPGRGVRTKATAQALQVDAKALRGLSIAEVETLLALMKRLRSNLSE